MQNANDINNEIKNENINDINNYLSSENNEMNNKKFKDEINEKIKDNRAMDRINKIRKKNFTEEKKYQKSDKIQNIANKLEKVMFGKRDD